MKKFATQPYKMQQVFNKQFDHIDQICEADTAFETKIGQNTMVDHTVLKKLRTKEMKPMVLGETRELIKQDACIEAVYDPEA